MGHPYSPPSASIPGYAPNTTPLLSLAAAFVALISLCVGACVAAAAANPYGHKLRRLDVFAVGWFALCGFLHCFFEGYVVYYQHEVAGSQSLFAQLWKEYAYGDSRYLAVDNFTMCIETITVLVWGPLCWFTVYAILTRSPSRHLAQAIVSVAHVYSLALYFLTEHRNESLTGLSSSLPGFYYWVYYLGFNVLWAIVPLYLLHDSWTATSRVFKTVHAQQDLRKWK